jgi:predicted permease
MTGLWQDVRNAARQLWKNPGLTVVVVITLALGLGANTAIFSVINSALIAPLPYPAPKQLVEVFETIGRDSQRNAVSGGAFKDWRDNATSFSHLAVYERARANLTGRSAPERVSGLMVSSEFLKVLGLRPVIGRDFNNDADVVGGNNEEVILTDKFWRSRFGADPEIIGRTLLLDQNPYTVIGVLPPKALVDDDVQYLVPDVIDAEGVFWGRAGHWRSVIGRLWPGKTVSSAQAELRAVKERLNSEYPAFKKDWSVAVVPLQEAYAEVPRPLLITLLGAVALVLLIACANVANLLLARGTARSREMALRTALGASSWRIARQLLVESLVLALTGCAVGWLFAGLGVRLLSGMLAGMLPHLLLPELDLNVLAFSVLAACGCGILCGVFPAARARRLDPNQDLKESVRGSKSASKRRTQSLVVVSEFAFTVILLIGAGLFLRSFVQLLQTDPGFDPTDTLAFDVSLPVAKYPNAEGQYRFIHAVNERLTALPGVEAVGATSALPLSKSGRTEFIRKVDQPPEANLLASCNFVSGEYLEAMGIRLVRGRTITEEDNREPAARVLVIDETAVRQVFQGEDPIGQRLTFLGESWEIVGVVAPIRQFFLEWDPKPTVYGPQSFAPMPTSMVIRTALSPSELSETVRKTILQLDPDQPIANVRTLDQAVHRSLASKRAVLILVALFAVIAVSLSCIGIYGVMAHSIGQRTRELGIRLAVGAQRRDILVLILKGGMKPSVVGIVVGLAVAFAVSRLIQSQLFEVKAQDPLVFALSVCLLAAVAAIAIGVAGRRATRTNPVDALRTE